MTAVIGYTACVRACLRFTLRNNAALLLVACLAITLAWRSVEAATLSSGALSVDYGPPWQRAEATEEERLESAVLKHESAAGRLTLLLPRHHPRLRLPAERYFQQLDMIWRLLYGDRTQIDWLELGERRWRVLRRPSLEHDDAVVFQLVTVIDAQAHHVLVYAPKTTVALPEPVVRLLADIPPAASACLQCAPASMEEGAQRSAEAGNDGQQPAADAAPQLAEASAQYAWRLAQTLRPRIGPAELDELMAMEHRALVTDGGITGIALEASEHTLKAFIEGFLWEQGPRHRPLKRRFARQWALAWQPPPHVWQQGQAVTLSVQVTGESEPLRLDVELQPLCGPADELLQRLAGPAGMQAGIGERMRATDAACRGAGAGRIQAEMNLSPAKTTRSLALVPPDPARLAKDEPNLLVLSLRPHIGAGAGQSLLSRASFHYVYRRQHAAEP